MEGSATARGATVLKTEDFVLIISLPEHKQNIENKITVLCQFTNNIWKVQNKPIDRSTLQGSKSIKWFTILHGS